MAKFRRVLFIINVVKEWQPWLLWNSLTTLCSTYTSSNITIYWYRYVFKLIQKQTSCGWYYFGVALWRYVEEMICFSNLFIIYFMFISFTKQKDWYNFCYSKRPAFIMSYIVMTCFRAFKEFTTLYVLWISKLWMFYELSIDLPMSSMESDRLLKLAAAIINTVYSLLLPPYKHPSQSSRCWVLLIIISELTA